MKKLTLSESMSICLSNNIIIKPEGELINDSLYHFHIFVNGKKIDKLIKVKPKQKDSKKNKTGFYELNQAIIKTYLYYAEKNNSKK